MKKQFTFLTLLFLLGASKLFAQCTLTASASVTSNYNGAQISCNGAADGVAIAAAADGVGPYSYTWSAGAGNQSTPTATALGAGIYSVDVEDLGAFGCIVTATVELVEPTALTQTLSSTNVTCNGSANGSATVSPSGGTGAYSYQWSNGAVASSISSLSPGVYTHTLTDINGCSAVASTTITQPATLLVPQSSITSSISCNGELAVVTVTATGGQAPYVGVGTFSVSAGAHTYTVTDDNGCALTTSVSVTEPDVIAPLSSITTSILCNGGNAVVTVTATGGTGSLAGIADYTVAAGVQTFTVTDDNSCAVTTTINITEPDALVASATSSATCGSTVATVEVSATGGTIAYTGVGTFTALAGPQSYTVTDANSCSSVATITVALVTNTLTPSFTVGKIDANCVGVDNGSAWTRTVAPGTGLVLPLSYSWSPSAQTTQTATALAAGVYTCFITDGNGCTYSRTVSVGPTAPAELPITVAPSLTICPATTTTLSVQGVPSYTWSTGANTSSIVVTPTVTTDYTVTGTSFLGCTVMSTVTIVTSTATCLGLNESDFLTASVYPNPAKDMITVSLAKNYDNCSIQVFDAYGKLVLTEQLIGTETTLQTGKLQNGIYFYQIKANGLIISRNKLIKN